MGDELLPPLAPIIGRDHVSSTDHRAAAAREAANDRDAMGAYLSELGIREVEVIPGWGLLEPHERLVESSDHAGPDEHGIWLACLSVAVDVCA